MLSFSSRVQLFATPWTIACQVPLSLGILQTRILEWVAVPSSRGSSQSRIKPRSPTFGADSLPAEPQEKPKNTGVGSLSLSPENLLNPGIKPGSPALQADSSPTELSGKNPPAMWETWVQSLGWEVPWRREWLPTPVFWPGEFHGLQSMRLQRVRHLSDFHFYLGLP